MPSIAGADVQHAPGLDFYEIFENHGSIMMILDSETGDIVYVNRAAREFYGYSNEVFMNMNKDDINILSQEEIDIELAAAAAEERNFFRFRHSLASREIRDVEVFSYPQVFEGKTYLFSVIIDVTDRVNLENRQTIIEYVVRALAVFFFAMLFYMLFKLNKSFQEQSKSAAKFAEAEKKYQTMLDHVPGMVYRCIFNRNWTTIYASSGTLELTGYMPEEIINDNRAYNDLITTDYKDYLWEKWQEISKTHGILVEEYTIRNKKGELRWVWEHAGMIYDENEKPDSIVGIIVDITEKRNVLNLVQKSEARLVATLSSLKDAVFSTDENCLIDYMNSEAEILLGKKYIDVRGKHADEVFVFLDKITLLPIDKPIEYTLEDKNKIKQVFDICLINKYGIQLIVEMVLSPIIENEDKVLGVVGVLRDRTLIEQRQRDIEYLSFHDHLTGLYNRRFFEEELKRLDTKRNLPIAILMADVDNLKKMNDTLGHEAGDQLIQKVADVLSDELRGDDIISRIGGDEFVVLLPKTDAYTAETLTIRLNEVFKRSSVLGIPISVSIGFDIKTTAHQTLRNVMKNAENMMYKNKSEKNSILVRGKHSTLLKKFVLKKEKL